MRRSNLASILGLKTEDDDGEATRMNPDDYIKRITHSKTIEDLHRNYINVMAEVKSDKVLSQAIVTAKDETKKVLERLL
jgi:hypothetical protein